LDNPTITLIVFSTKFMYYKQNKRTWFWISSSWDF